MWAPLEHTLSSGARDAALGGLEALAEETLAELAIDDLEPVRRKLDRMHLRERAFLLAFADRAAHGTHEINVFHGISSLALPP